PFVRADRDLVEAQSQHRLGARGDVRRARRRRVLRDRSVRRQDHVGDASGGDQARADRAAFTGARAAGESGTNRIRVARLDRSENRDSIPSPGFRCAQSSYRAVQIAIVFIVRSSISPRKRAKRRGLRAERIWIAARTALPGSRTVITGTFRGIRKHDQTSSGNSSALAGTVITGTVDIAESVGPAPFERPI